MTLQPYLPVVGICGYSGSGKTTLIEQLIPQFIRDGLAVAVIKHDAHRLEVDKPGKDSNRFFNAGATVFAHDPSQGFLRFTSRCKPSFNDAIELLLQEHDLVLVEGHKQTDLPFKLWLRTSADDSPPADANNISAQLGPGGHRSDSAYKLISDRLASIITKAPLRAGILIGGKSSRMGQPKHLISFRGQTWLEYQYSLLSGFADSVILLGEGEVPASLNNLVRVPDSPGRAGPLAGMLAAMNWDRDSDWLFVACDMPLITTESIQWLLDNRTPGFWALMPQSAVDGHVEPLFSWFSRRMRSRLLRSDRPVALAGDINTRLLQLPLHFQQALSNINTPEGRASWEADQS